MSSFLMGIIEKRKYFYYDSGMTILMGRSTL